MELLGLTPHQTHALFLDTIDEQEAVNLLKSYVAQAEAQEAQ